MGEIGKLTISLLKVFKTRNGRPFSHIFIYFVLLKDEVLSDLNITSNFTFLLVYKTKLY